MAQLYACASLEVAPTTLACHHVTTVSVGALYPGLQCWHATASAFRQPSSTCRTAFPAQHLRPSRSQLLARWLGTHSQILSGIQRAAQTVLSVCLKRTCSCDISASSAFRVLNDNALYKFTHSLTDDLDQCVTLCKFIRAVTAVPNSHCPTRLDKLSTNSSVNMALHFSVNWRVHIITNRYYVTLQGLRDQPKAFSKLA